MFNKYIIISTRVKPLVTNLREAGSLMELDRDERKLEVFLSFHRSTLTAADLKIFLPFTINLDPYVKKVIKGKTIKGLYLPDRKLKEWCLNNQ